MTIRHSDSKFFVYAHIEGFQSCLMRTRTSRNSVILSHSIGISKHKNLTMVTPLNSLALLRSFCKTVHGSAMSNAPNAFTNHFFGDDDDNDSKFSASSSNKRSRNDPNSANHQNNKAGQLETLFIMQKYLQPSSLSSHGSPSKSFGHSTGNFAAPNRAAEPPSQAHTVDRTLFTTSDAVKHTLFSDKEDDDDRLLNQILFASDNQTVSSLPNVANPTSEFSPEKETTAYAPNLDQVHHQHPHHSNSTYGIASSHQEPVDSSVFSSMVWHPAYQPNHQEVAYNESIFATETANTTLDIQPLEFHPPRASTASRSIGNYGVWTHSSDVNLSLNTSSNKHFAALPTSTSGTEALLYAAELAGVPPNEPPTVASIKPASKSRPKTSKQSKATRVDEIVNATATNSVSSGQDSTTEINIIFIPHHEITENDVLLGRGGRTNHHPGNKYYLECKAVLQDQYLRADKDEKTMLSHHLVQMIHDRRGRFLKLAEPDLVERANVDRGTFGSSLLWYEISLAVARRKASQTLRELNTPELRAAKRAKYAK